MKDLKFILISIAFIFFSFNPHSLAKTISQDLKLSSDLTENEDIVVDNATLDLNGYTLTVNGNLTFKNNAVLKMLNGKSMPVPVSYALSFFYKDKLYVIGGSNNSGQTVDKIQIFDLTTEKWSTLDTTLKSPREQAIGCFYNGKFYVLGGYDSNENQSLSSIEEFDPESNTITLLQEKLPFDLYGAAYAKIEENLYIIGGKSFESLDKSKIQDTIIRYNLNTKTSEVLDLKLQNRRYLASAAHLNDQRIIIVGGYVPNSNWVKKVNDSEILNLNSDLITGGPYLLGVQYGVAEHLVINVGGEVYLIGGKQGPEYASEYTDQVYKLSAGESQWEPYAKLSEPIAGLNAVISQENSKKLLLVGGKNNKWTSPYVYDFDLSTKYIKRFISFGNLYVNGNLIFEGGYLTPMPSENNLLLAGTIFLTKDLKQIGSYPLKTYDDLYIKLCSDKVPQHIVTAQPALIENLIVANGVQAQVAITEKDMTSSTGWTYQYGYWTDSYAGNYQDNSNSTLVSSPFSLKGFKEPYVVLNHKYYLEDGFDFVYLEASIDNGKSFFKIKEFTGMLLYYSEVDKIALTNLADKDNVILRLRLISNSTNTFDGYYLYSLKVIEGSALIVDGNLTIKNLVVDSSVISEFLSPDIYKLSNGGKFALALKQNLDIQGDTAFYSLKTNGYDVDVKGYKLNVEELWINGGNFNLNGGELTVEKELWLTGGNFILGKGSATVKGDMVTSGDSVLKMLNQEDLLVVEGNLEVGGGYASWNLVSGTIKVGGDFKVQGWYGFYATGSHTVVLNGKAEQKISFSDYSNKFNNLKIENTEWVKFETPCYVDSLYAPGAVTKISGLNLKSYFNLQSAISSFGDMTISAGCDLNGYTLTVHGNLYLTGGAISFNKSTLIVKGNVITSGSSALKMLNQEDLLVVEGNLEVGGGNTPGNLVSGTIKVGGDFKVQGWYGFYATGSHTVVLNGTKEQKINFKGIDLQFSNLTLLNKNVSVDQQSDQIKVAGKLAHRQEWTDNGIKDIIPAKIEAQQFTLSMDADGDLIDDECDAFPNNPAAFIDIDGDGIPEFLFPGWTEQSSGLKLDIVDQDFDKKYLAYAYKFTYDPSVFELYAQLGGISQDGTSVEVTVTLINKSTKEQYIINNYFFRSPNFPKEIVLKDNKLVSAVTAHADLYFSYGNLGIIKEHKFYAIPEPENVVNPLSYQDQPFSVDIGKGYKDILTKINQDPLKTRWLKIPSQNEQTIIAFGYGVLSGTQVYVKEGAQITLLLYKEEKGTKKLVGQRMFDPSKAFNLDLVLEKDKVYYVELKPNSGVDQVEYNFSFTKLTKESELTVHYFKFKLDNSGKYEIPKFILPKTTTYKFFVDSEFIIKGFLSDASGTLTSFENSVSSQTKLGLKPGIYRMDFQGTPNSTAIVRIDLIKEEDYLEVELNNNLKNAMPYEGKTIMTLTKQDEDYIAFKPQFSYYDNSNVLSIATQIISGLSNNSKIEMYILNPAGEEYAYMIGSLGDKFEFKGYPFDNEKVYGLLVRPYSNLDKQLTFSIEIPDVGRPTNIEEESYGKLYSQSKQGTLTENLEIEWGVDIEDMGNLIIVTGDSDNPGDKLWSKSQMLSADMYVRFLLRGLSHDDIYWINYKTDVDINKDGKPDMVVDSKELKTENILNAISTWAASGNNSKKKGPLYIYLVDHAVDKTFKVSAKEQLTAFQLKEAIQDFITKTDRYVVVIIEACHSGSFVDIITDNGSNPKVAFVSSSQGEQLSYIGEGGESFTKFFGDYIMKGYNLFESFEKAKVKLKSLGGVYKNQDPMFLAGSDYLKSLVVGGSFATADAETIQVSSVKIDGKPEPNFSPVDLQTKSNISFEVSLNTSVGVEKVWAVVIPPNYEQETFQDFQSPDLSIYSVTLVYDKETDSYKGEYSFTAQKVSGQYSITILAKDIYGMIYSKTFMVDVNGTTEGKKIYQLSIKQGWNLLSSLVSIGTEDGIDQAPFISVWKWTKNNWAVRIPKNEDKGQAYANLKGFELLTSIKPGEGFWVNSESETIFTANGYEDDDVIQVNAGWNLVGLKKAKTVNVEDLVGNNSGNILSIWKWVSNNWEVYLPNAPDKGQVYANAKGFGLLQSISHGEGFWVNAIAGFGLN